MAEPESILQLGIEAAREGKKDEARQLFRLLTRQEPENAQGWLWLAGVAENREERQNALERVLTLDPQNEMAIKGLNALGVRPSTTMRAGIHEVPPPPPTPPAPTEAITDDAFEDDPFAELDNLADAISADTSGPVRRAEGVPHHVDPQDEKLAADRAAMLAATSQRRRDEGEPARSRRSGDYNDEYEEPRRGFSPLLALLLFLVGLGLVGLLLAFLFSDFFGGTQIAEPNATQQAIVAATATALAENPIIGGEPTADPGDPGTEPGEPGEPGTDPGEPGTDPGQPGEPGTDPGQPGEPGTDPGQPSEPEQPVEPPLPPADVSDANPIILPANTPLSSEGWLYDFNQPTFAASVIGDIRQFSPQNGRFVVVLAYAVNSTGVSQSIPAEFFVIKDAQGRVWEARPDVSEAYVVPGVNADLAHTQAMPPDGLTRSVAIVFDVALDATDLVFFARSNPSQGWLVLRSV